MIWSSLVLIGTLSVVLSQAFTPDNSILGSDVFKDAVRTVRLAKFYAIIPPQPMGEHGKKYGEPRTWQQNDDFCKAQNIGRAGYENPTIQDHIVLRRLLTEQATNYSFKFWTSGYDQGSYVWTTNKNRTVEDRVYWPPTSTMPDEHFWAANQPFHSNRGVYLVWNHVEKTLKGAVADVNEKFGTFCVRNAPEGSGYTKFDN